MYHHSKSLTSLPPHAVGFASPPSVIEFYPLYGFRILTCAGAPSLGCAVAFPAVYIRSPSTICLANLIPCCSRIRSHSSQAISTSRSRATRTSTNLSTTMANSCPRHLLGPSWNPRHMSFAGCNISPSGTRYRSGINSEGSWKLAGSLCMAIELSKRSNPSVGQTVLESFI